MPVAPGNDAWTVITQTLKSYGLGERSLSDWVLESLRVGNSIEQILLELEQRPEYDRAFPEIKLRNAEMASRGVQWEPIGPAEILEYRTRVAEMMKARGLPESFQRSDKVRELIVNNVSLAEVDERLELVSRRVAHAPPEVRAVFGEIFGQQTDHALYLAFTNADASLPALEDMVQAAEAGGAARRLGFGLSAAESKRVADLNLTYEQAVEGFSNLGAVRGLFNETLYEADDMKVGVEGIAAAFNTEGGEALGRRGEERAAETSGGLGAAASERGVQGLGAAGRR